MEITVDNDRESYGQKSCQRGLKENLRQGIEDMGQFFRSFIANQSKPMGG